jgi:hypothetical protein
MQKSPAAMEPGSGAWSHDASDDRIFQRDLEPDGSADPPKRGAIKSDASVRESLEFGSAVRN